MHLVDERKASVVSSLPAPPLPRLPLVRVGNREAVARDRHNPLLAIVVVEPTGLQRREPRLHGGWVVLFSRFLFVLALSRRLCSIVFVSCPWRVVKFLFHFLSTAHTHDLLHLPSQKKKRPYPVENDILCARKGEAVNTVPFVLRHHEEKNEKCTWWLASPSH